jgi:hypothetical protein
MSEKYQQEIEEILKESGELVPSSRSGKTRFDLWRLIQLYATNSLGGKIWSLTPGRVIVAAVSLLLLALLFARVVPGIGGPVALAGLLLFIIGYGMFFVQPRGIEKRWRGQLVDQEDNSWWDRFRRKTR